MNKSDLIEALAAKSGLPKTRAADILTFLFDSEAGIIPAELKAGNDVAIHGFGVFRVVDRPARAGINPKTKETIQIEAKKSPKFTAGKPLKLAVA